MVRKIIQIGDNRLLEESKEISKEELNSKEIKQIAEDLVDTIKHYNETAAGLSAVQIGVMKRIFAVKIEKEDSEEVEYKVLINPEIEKQSTETTIVWEGCMSISSKNQRLYGPVERSKEVRIKYTDLQGNTQRIQAEEFYSHLLLHEMDHLDGKLFLQYVSNPENLWNEEDLDKYLEQYNKFPPVV